MEEIVNLECESFLTALSAFLLPFGIGFILLMGWCFLSGKEVRFVDRSRR